MLHRLKQMSWDLRKIRGLRRKEGKETKQRGKEAKQREKRKSEKKKRSEKEGEKKKGRRRLLALSRRRLYGCPRTEEK